MKQVLCFFLLLPLVAVSQTVTIPDANFKAKLIQLGVDTNADGEIDETEAFDVNNLDISSSGIYSIQGIESFVNLINLNCSGNFLSGNIDFSNNVNLFSLDSSNNLITGINLNGLTNLFDLNLGQNPNLTQLNATSCSSLVSIGNLPQSIESVNVSNCSSLLEVFISNTNLNSINLSGCNSIINIILSDNNLTSLDLTGMSNLTVISCENNQITSLNLTGCTSILDLYCQNNLIEGVIDFSGSLVLESLNCRNNMLTSINVSGCTNLSFFELGGPQLLDLNASGCTALVNFDMGDVSSIQNIDISNCSSLLDLTFEFPNLQSLNLEGCTSLMQIGDFSGNQLTSINLSGLLNLNTFAYENSQLNSITITNCPNLSYLHLVNLNLSELDVSMLPNLTYLYVQQNQLTTLDVSSNTLLTDLNVSSNPIETLFVKNGTSETIDLSNTTSLYYICSDESQVEQLSSQTTAEVNSYCSLFPGGAYNIISGTITYDANIDGCDDLDSNPQFYKIKLVGPDNTYYSFTDSQGEFSFSTGLGDFVVTPIPAVSGTIEASPLESLVTFSNYETDSVSNFCLVPSPFQNLEIATMPTSNAIAGDQATYSLVFRNTGNQMVSGTIEIDYDDAKMSYQSSSITPVTESNGMIVWSYSDLKPYEIRKIDLTMNINPAVVLGDILPLQSSITPSVGDAIVGDNSFDYNQRVVNSPNLNVIECLEGEAASDLLIGDYLHYIINFENSGSATVNNVVLQMEIDPSKFDVNSLQILSASHAVTIKQTGNILEIFFPNCQIDTGGHGNVLLKIRTGNTMITGDSVSVNAAIYFDYNAPINTNTFETAFLDSSEFSSDTSVLIFPNPTSSLLNITSNYEIKVVQVYDSLGRLLETHLPNHEEMQINFAEMATGVYFIKVFSERGYSVQKIVKE